MVSACGWDLTHLNASLSLCGVRDSRPSSHPRNLRCIANWRRAAHGCVVLEVYLLRILMVLLLSLSLSGCAGHRIWPFGKKAPLVPETAAVFVVGGGGPSVAQFWQRNAVVMDLQGLTGSGTVVAQLAEGYRWPSRVVLRVRPGSVGELEVVGAQRLILPVAVDGTAPIDLELPPSVYRRDTPGLTISWRNREAPAGT